jgi:hypothetical protein
VSPGIQLPTFRGTWLSKVLTSASVRTVMISGIFNGRGRGRDQFGRDNALLLTQTARLLRLSLFRLLDDLDCQARVGHVALFALDLRFIGNRAVNRLDQALKLHKSTAHIFCVAALIIRS